LIETIALTITVHSVTTGRITGLANTLAVIALQAARLAVPVSKQGFQAAPMITQQHLAFITAALMGLTNLIMTLGFRAVLIFGAGSHDDALFTVRGALFHRVVMTDQLRGNTESCPTTFAVRLTVIRNASSQN